MSPGHRIPSVSLDSFTSVASAVTRLFGSLLVWNTRAVLIGDPALLWATRTVRNCYWWLDLWLVVRIMFLAVTADILSIFGQHRVTTTGWAAASLVVTFTLFAIRLFLAFPDAVLNRVCTVRAFLTFVVGCWSWYTNITVSPDGIDTNRSSPHPERHQR